MHRRSFVAIALAGAASTKAAFALGRTIGITEVSVNPRQPRAGSNGFGREKGVMSFRVIARPPLAGNQYKGIESWGNGDGSGIYQCVEIIRRYAQKLEFVGYEQSVQFKNLPSLGNGDQCARNFARKSEGAFRYVGGSSAALPKIGSVVSVAGWAAVPEGHVGIVQMAPQVSGDTATVTLFDQNFPSATWKTLTFSRANGVWAGNLRNTSSNGTATNAAVVGWADPTE